MLMGDTWYATFANTSTDTENLWAIGRQEQALVLLLLVETMRTTFLGYMITSKHFVLRFSNLTRYGRRL